MLDKACKDKKHKKMSQDLRIEIQYEFVDVSGKNKDVKAPVLEPSMIQKSFDI